MIRCDGLWPGYATCDSKEDFQPGLLHIASELLHSIAPALEYFFSFLVPNKYVASVCNRQTTTPATSVMTSSYQKRKELDYLMS